MQSSAEGAFDHYIDRSGIRSLPVTQAIVACGELDVAIKVRRSAELAEELPNATYLALPGRAHLPYLEAADEIAALIMAEAV